MTQRGLRLRRDGAYLRRTAYALATVSALLLTPVALLAAMTLAAPAMTRTRTARPRPAIVQPVTASVSRGTAKAGSHKPAKRGVGKVPVATATAHESFKTSDLKHGKALRAAAEPQAPFVAAHGRLRGRQVEARNPVAMRRGSAHRWTASNSAEIAAYKTPIHIAPPAAAFAGGELTMDQFTQVADAAAGGSPMIAAANPHNSPPAQRVNGFGAEGFGAEGAGLGQPTIATTDTVPDAAIVRAAAGDSRVRALVHPSHEQMAEELAEPVVLPGLYRNGRLVVPAPMKGSHDILVHQNAMANDEGLERVRDEDDLQRMRASRQLVDFPESQSLRVNPELGSDRRCARVWTVKFAEDTAHAFYARFHAPLQVNSAVRTVAYQVRLQRTNGNAAGIGGETASPHLTGQAIDFGKRGMSVEEIAWMRAYLKPMMDAGNVDVEEEFQQACFHISVYKSYLPAIPTVRRVQVAAVLRPVVVDR